MATEELNDLTQEVIAAIFEVSNTLGCGFLEKVYERALTEELRLRGFRTDAQVGWEVRYKGVWVRKYVADLVVGGRLVVEVKCVETIVGEHLAQCLNYLRVSGKETGLVVNFRHPRVEWKRVHRVESQNLKPKAF